MSKLTQEQILQNNLNLPQYQKKLIKTRNHNFNFEPSSPINEYSDPETENDDISEDISLDNNEYDDDLRIDNLHLDDPLHLAKYARKIFSIAAQSINSQPITQEYFLSIQDQVTPQCREIGGRWLFNLQELTSVGNDTLFIANTYLNIVLSKIHVPKEKFQLYVITCFWIASKIEERANSSLQDLCKLSNHKYQAKEFLEKEKQIIQLLNFQLNYPTSKFFLRRYLEIVNANDEISEAANFFNDISILRVELLDFNVKEIAFTAVWLAKLSLKQFCSIVRLMEYAEIKDINSIKKCASVLLYFANQYKQKKDHVLIKRYSGPNFLGVLRKLDTSQKIIDKI